MAFWLAIVGALGLGTAPSHALDRPVDGVKLIAKRSGTREKLVFVSKDADVPIPGIGSGDDPATGTPGGARIDLFAASGESATFDVPPGTGAPGWTVRDAATDLFRYVNPGAPGGPSPVQTLVLRQERVLRVIVKATGLALGGPQGGVGIRFTMGTLRTCALFDASTAVRDEANAFVARGAEAASLADCSDVSLGATPSTSTTSSTTTTSTFCSTAICTVGFGGCCPGLTCQPTGGPENMGFCTSATCGGATSACGIGALPCCEGLLCVNVGGEFGFCCTAAGEACSSDGQCCSGTCTGGVCGLGPSGCCQGTFSGVDFCFDVPAYQVQFCGDFGGSGAPGVCDGTSGTCQPLRSGVGSCCDTTPHCAEAPPSPLFTSLCSGVGTEFPGQACLPTGSCGAP